MPILLTAFANSLWAGDALYALPGSSTASPPGLEATLEYNGIIMHDRSVVDKYRVMLMDGLQGADIRDNREANPSDHGETPFDNYLGGRTILLTGRVEAHNIGKLRDMQEALRTAFYSMTERPLIFHVGNIQRDVQIGCRISDKISMPEKQDDFRTFRDFSITLHATDPRFRSIIDRVYSATFGLLDDNASNTVTQWTTISGSAPTASSSVLNLATGTSLILRNDLGYKPIDSQHTAKITTPATITTNDEINLILKYVDATNYIQARLLFQSATTAALTITKVVAGTPTNLVVGSSVAVAANTNYWLQASISGNVITHKIFTTDPSGGGGTQLGSTLTQTLGTGTSVAGDITAFGTGVQAQVGVRSVSVQSYKLDDYRIEALSLNHQIYTPNNMGNFMALPKVRIYGPMTNVTIRNETIMPDEALTRSVVINGTIPAGRYYEYNAATGTLQDDLGVNKFSQLSTTSKQLQLRDGDNQLTIVASGLSGITPRLVTTFNDTWI